LASNIQRLVEIADLIDVQVFAGTRMEVYQPKVASAEELAQEMTKVMQSFAASTQQSDGFVAQFIPLPRINQLLVISHSEAAWTYAKRWLDRIDVVAEGPGRRIFIYPVENGKATELADVLSQALGQPSTGRRDSTRTLQDLHRSTTGGTPALSGRGAPGTSFGSPGTPFGSQGSFGQQTPLGAYATIPVPGQVTPPPVTPTPPGAAPAPGVPRPPTPTTPAQQQPPEQLRIVPDPATNSLIIYGTVQEFQNIRNILKELDAIPRQVLIEAMVLQVDLNDAESLGVDYEILRRSRVTIFGQTFNSRGALRSLGDNFPIPPAFGGGSGLTGIFGGNDVQALVNALMTDSRVKLLSSPSVLAADNRPARIQVGSEEPIPTGTITAAVGAATPSSSTAIQYRNTGRILTIIPQVNAKGLVNLQIKAEVSQRGEDVPFGSGETYPSFNTQDAETTAVVHDGETLVIGGLIGERRSRTRSGIPYLMDIPVFGRFFGTTSDEDRRTELIMLITPYVVRNQSESRQVTEEFKAKVEAVRNELERIERDRAKPRPTTPVEPSGTVEPRRSEKRLPPPAPSKPAPRTGASLEPNSDGPNRGVSLGESQSADKRWETEPYRSRPANGAPAIQPINQQLTGETSPEPAYLLSLARLAPAPAVAPRVTAPLLPQPRVSSPRVIPPPAPQQPAASQPHKDRKVGRQQWGVQIAAFADRKDADTLVKELRQDGYDAFVLTGPAESKTWHRVRVGQFIDIAAAKRVREVLSEQAQFKDAYVAAN
jgi:type II secretion system protein D